MKTDLADTLRLFQDLTSQLGKQKRTEKLLKIPQSESPVEWFMCAPTFFNNALDIRNTERKKDKQSYWVWTQGADFSFSVGDTLYDTFEAYKPWNEALITVNICLQVTRAVPAGGSDSGFRFPGKISADVLLPNKQRTKLRKALEIEMTQHEFVSFIIFGPEKHLSERIESTQK